MSIGRFATALLVVLLIASNAWWAYRVLDAGISYTYLSASHEYAAAALSQTRSLCPVAARLDATRDEVVRAARLPGDTNEPYEKDGYVWVGQVGLQFNQEGRLAALSDGSDVP